MSHENLITTTSEQWVEAELGGASELDLKTKALCYLSALAAASLASEVPFRAARARALGATRDEVLGAILVGLRAIGRADIDHPLPTFGATG